MTDKVDSAIYYFDHNTNKVNTIRLQTFLNRVNNYSNGRINNKTYFALIFLVCIIAIHFDFTLGLLIAGTFAVKFFFMLPNNREGL